MGELFEKYSPSWSRESVGAVNTPSRSARNLLYYVQGVGHFKTTPAYFTERANLSSFLMICTLSGQGILETGETVTALTPGSCMFLDCMQHHCYRTAPGMDNWEFYYLHFNGANSLGFFQEFLRAGSYAVDVQDFEGFSRLFQEILDLQHEHSFTVELKTNQKITEILTRLLLSCGRISTALEAWPPYMGRIVAQIEHSFAENLTLDGLAQEYGISKFHLSREFKRLTGSTFSDYLLRVRLNHTKEMLRFTNLPISEVAFQCGFNDVSHFIRMFRSRENNVTPLSYRKHWSELEHRPDSADPALVSRIGR